MALQDMLKKLLSEKNIKPADLARESGVSEAMLSYYINGKREPMGKTCVALAKALHVSLDELLESPFAEQEKAKREQTPTALSPEQQEYLKKYYALNHEGRGRVHATIDYEFAKQHGAKKVVSEIIFPPETVTLTRPSLPVCAGMGNYLDDNIEYEEVKVLKNKYTYGADYIIKLQGDSMEPEFHDGDNLIVTDARGTEPIYGRVGIFIVNGDAIFRQPLRGRLHPYNDNYEDKVITEYDDFRYVGYVVGIIDDSWVIP